MNPFLLGILVNITTSSGGYIFKKFIGEPSIESQIKSAYDDAIKTWISNKDIRRKEEIWSKRRINQIIRCYETHNFDGLDSDIIDLYKLFEKTIAKQPEASRYLSNIKENKQLEYLEYIMLISQEIKSIVSNKKDEKSIDEVIQNWDIKVREQLKDINVNILKNHHSPNNSKSILSIFFEQFINGKKWKDKIFKNFKNIKKHQSSISTNKANQIFKILLETDLSKNNEAIRVDLLQFFFDIEPIKFVDKEIVKLNENKINSDYYHEIKYELLKLKKLINNPNYGSCFLIKGSTGSGKTHFIYQMLKEYAIPSIYFSIKDSNKSFTINLIDTINELICLDFKSLHDFIAFLKKNSIKRKILIIIENIEKLNKSFYDELFKLMEECTSIPNLLWILSVNSNYFDTPSEYEQKFNKYIHHFNLISDIDCELLINSGWFDLNYSNRIEEIGKKIITKDLKINETLEGINHYKGKNIESLNSIDPFLAWIIYEILSLDNRFNFIDFVLLEIIKKLDEYFELRYDRNLSSLNSILEFVNFTCNIILSQKQIVFNRISLQNNVSSLASDISELENKDLTKDTLQNLYNIGLISRDFTSFRNFNTIYLNTCIYWQFSVANKIFEKNDVDLLNPFLESNDNSLKIFAENVFEYLLLIQEQKNHSLSSDFNLNSLFELVNSKNIPKSSFWFACLKLNKTTQTQSVSIIRNKKLPLFDDKHDLFALIQCITFLNPEIYKIDDKFDDFKYLLFKISEYKLDSIVLFSLRTIISECSNLNSLFMSIKHLHGIEVLDIQKQVSKYLIDRAFTLANNTEEIITFFEIYLHKNCHSSESYKAKGAYGKLIWKRYFIREWIIYFLFDKIVHLEKLNSYNYLKQCGFYTNENNKFSKQISHELRRESNIIVGSLYEDYPKTINDFFTFLDELLYSKDIIDRENCFHIIRHTVPTHGSNKVLLDKKFNKYLIKIFNDPLMEEIRKGFMPIFEINGIKKVMQKSKFKNKKNKH